MYFFCSILFIFSLAVSSDSYKSIEVSEVKENLSNEIFKKLSREHYVKNFDKTDFNKNYINAVFKRLDEEKKYFIQNEVDSFIKESKYETNNFVESYIYSRRIIRKNLQDMNPNKLFNYMIQLMETENNVKILNELQPKLQQYESKLVLYNYDSFLFDFNTKDGLEFLNMVKETIESGGKYPVKVSKGVNYHEMQDITEKFK